MQPEAFECVDVTSAANAFPLRFQQGARRAPSLMSLAGLTALATAVVAPQLALASYALASPSIRQAILEQPVVVFQLAIALAFWISLFAWLLKSLVARATQSRNVEITSEFVAVNEVRAFRSSQWFEPLGHYRGIAHHIRSSLAGTRHELVLVNPDARRSVLLRASDCISDAEISQMCRLLRLPQISPATLYRRPKGTKSLANTLSLQPLPA